MGGCRLSLMAVVGALLGAEEFVFATAPLVVFFQAEDGIRDKAT